jgi:hypothetical protein
VPQCQTHSFGGWAFFNSEFTYGELVQALSINPNFAIAKSNMAIALTDYGTFIKNQGKRVVSNYYFLLFF